MTPIATQRLDGWVVTSERISDDDELIRVIDAISDSFGDDEMAAWTFISDLDAAAQILEQRARDGAAELRWAALSQARERAIRVASAQRARLQGSQSRLLASLLARSWGSIDAMTSSIAGQVGGHDDLVVRSLIDRCPRRIVQMALSRWLEDTAEHGRADRARGAALLTARSEAHTSGGELDPDQHQRLNDLFDELDRRCFDSDDRHIVLIRPWVPDTLNHVEVPKALMAAWGRTLDPVRHVAVAVVPGNFTRFRGDLNGAYRICDAGRYDDDSDAVLTTLAALHTPGGSGELADAANALSAARHLTDM